MKWIYIYWQKSLAAILIVCAMLPCVQLFQIHHAIREVKLDMKRQLLTKNHSDLMTMTIAPDDLRSGKAIHYPQEQEIEIDGKLYDYTSYVVVDEKMSFRCISDTRETALKGELRAIMYQFLNQENSTKSTMEQVVHFLQNLFYLEFEFPLYGVSIPLVYTLVSSLMLVLLLSGHKKSWTAPPESKLIAF